MAQIIPMQVDNINIIREKQSNINRCCIGGCVKKLGLMPFVCRCEKEFCNKHRMPETHNCIFDYKTNGKKQLEAQNQCVTFEKILKI